MKRPSSVYIFKGIAMIIMIMLITSCKKDSITGDISGYIYFSGTQIPVTDAIIEINGQQSITTYSGYYKLSEIAVGDQDLTAKKDGFDTFSSVVSIKEGESALDFEMSSDVYTSKIYGYVEGEFTGASRSNRSITLMNPDDTPSTISTMSDSTGYFELFMVPHGKQKLLVKLIDVNVVIIEISIDSPEYLANIPIPEIYEIIDSRNQMRYDVLRIGTQTWMAENLAWFELASPSDQGSVDEPYYYITGYTGTSVMDARDNEYYQRFGVLYNWEAAMKACPAGWHLPSDEEWEVLEVQLGLNSNETQTAGWRISGGVGKKMKSINDWQAGSYGDNSSGFNACPGGQRYYQGNYNYIGTLASFWTSTKVGVSKAMSRKIGNDSNGILRTADQNDYGYSIRCIKDI